MKNLFIFFCFLFFGILSFSQNEVMVLVKTDSGEIKIKLYNKTPKHRDNFVKLVKEGYYNGTLFHRVIKGFMIQGGDPDSRNAKPDAELGNGGPTYTIDAEFIPEYFHKRGVLAAAREGDDVNPKKASSGSQFYIVQGKIWDDEKLDKIDKKYKKNFTTQQREVYKTIGGAPHLDGDYTVFGEVVEGMEVVDKIASTQTRQKDDRPLKDISMTITIVE